MTLIIMHKYVYVLYVVPPVISPFSFDSTVDAGASVQITCHVNVGDLPIQINWSFFGDSSKRTQTDIQTMKVGSRGSILMIDNVNFEHNGFYVCSAKNSASSTNYTAELKV